MIYFVIYALIGLAVGKLCSNYFLNKEYDRQMRSFSISNKSKYSDESDESYSARMKADAYGYALERSSIDRGFSFVLGALFWPISLLILLVVRIRKWSDNRGRRIYSFGFSKAGRDFLQAQKQVKLADEQRALEATQNEVWNAMVDVLNENKLNHMNYQKK